MLEQQKFGRFVAKARVAAGLSQDVLSAKMGYTTAQFISNIERGLASVPVARIDQYASLINVDNKEFFRRWSKAKQARYAARYEQARGA